jgi:hypothetical protein
MLVEQISTVAGRHQSNEFLSGRGQHGGSGRFRMIEYVADYNDKRTRDQSSVYVIQSLRSQGNVTASKCENYRYEVDCSPYVSSDTAS